MRTSAVLAMPIAPAAALLRSIARPCTKGPRSLIRTIIERPLREFVTRTRVPKGSVRCAAVIALGLNFSPDAARNLVERFFNKIKQCRRVATRYDKLAANYLAFIKLAAVRIWLRAYESTP